MNDVGCILLAAGNSARMGSPKQLLDFGGKPLLRHAAEVALSARFGRLTVVLGAESARVRSALEGLPVAIVENPQWAEGMGTSIQAGLARHITDRAVMLALGDQPFLTKATYNSLIEKFLDGGNGIVTAEYAGTVGVPALFSREFFPHLLDLGPNEGCKSVILEHAKSAIRISCPEAEIDVDTRADYDRALFARTR